MNIIENHYLALFNIHKFLCVNKNMYLCIVIIKNNNYMKNVFKIVITYMIALLLVNCYVADDYTVNSNFSLLSYSQTTVD